MPNRILREGILTSPRMAKLGWAEEVFYRRLHSVVDDFGRYYADAGLLRAACYPRQLNKVSDPDIGKWLRSCADAGLVRVYPAEDGERYLEVLDFGQQVRAKKSRFPGMRSTCIADAQQGQCEPPANAHLDVSVFVDVSEKNLLSQVPARPSADRPPLALVDAGKAEGEPPPSGPPDCPHREVLALWAEVLPALPQHLPEQWRGTRADHLRARWRETAAAKRWPDQAAGLAYLRKLFGYVGQSPFLAGRVPPRDGKRPFVVELEWLVNPANWAKVHEGKYHAEATTA